MRNVILGLAAVLATLLVADAARAGCRHAGAGFGGYGGYARHSALLFVRSAPVYAAPACDCPVPDVVPPLTFAAPAYGYGGGFLADTGAYYDYRSFRGVRRGFDYGYGGGFQGRRLPPVVRGGRRGGAEPGTGVIGLARGVARTAGNVVRAVVGR